jgi:phage/plasmid primase, P4 family, C-terminal domain
VRGLEAEVRNAIKEANDDVIQAKTARHRIARAFVQEFDFVYPEESVQGWRSVLYVFDPDSGIYEPRGEAVVERELERVAGDFTTNQVTREIVGKIERMSKTDDDLNTRPERLVVGNGILDLHTGELDPYTPDEYHTTRIDVDWRPDAGDPEAIDEFLHDVVDDEMVPTLYRLIAHTLYKEYIAEKAAILIGSGSNGKSMFLRLIEEFIGSWNIARRELHAFSEDDFALNNLRGKLANLATEIGERTVTDTTAFKKATGRDRIDAPVKYEKPVSFENYASLIFATNEMPVFTQDNHAIWRRWLYVDFPYTFDADDPAAKDPEPERVLKRRLFTDEEFEAVAGPMPAGDTAVGQRRAAVRRRDGRRRGSGQDETGRRARLCVRVGLSRECRPRRGVRAHQ